MSSSTNLKTVPSTCEFCGSTFYQSPKGRTKLYCNDDCSNATKFLSAFETSLLKIKKIDQYEKKILRSKLWSLANLTNNK